MLEQHVVQTRGFHNILDESGEATGFQLCTRTMYYKGVWLSQLRIGDVVVDGVAYGRDQQTWTINEVDYTPDQMLEIGDQDEPTYFQFFDTATIKVKKPGGLAQGYHTVSVTFGYVCNYIVGEDVEDPEFGIPAGGFSGGNDERHLLIV